MTQLTKDDVKTDSDITYKIPHGKSTEKYLNFSQFQQVVKFYDNYRDRPQLLYEEQIEVYHLFVKWFICNIEGNYHGELFEYLDRQDMNSVLKDWLFPYCFKDGLQ